MMKNKYTRKVILSIGLGLLGSVAAHAQQKIGSDPGNLHPGAVLELASSNRGFLLPRISIPNLGAWGLPGTATEGMMVYNNNGTTGAGYYVWSGGAWTRISIGTSANDLTFSNGLTRTGNAITLGGALAAPTTLTLGTQSLTFNASGSAQVIIQGPAGNTAGLRLSNLTGAGTAGTSGQKVLSVNASGDVVLVTDFGSNNAGTVTNVTGTAPITVTNGTTTPVIGINQAALDLNSIGGTLPISKITPSGTAGQVLTSNGAAAPTWTSLPAANNIYNSNGALTSDRILTQSNFDLTLTGSGTFNKFSGAAGASSFFNIGRTANEMDLGIGGGPNEGFGGAVAGDGWIKTLGTGTMRVGTFGVAPLALMTNNLQRMSISSAGVVQINNLSGTGSRMVVADASGVLSTQAVPSSSNIYNANGTLTGPRTVTLNSNVLTFLGSNAGSGTVAAETMLRLFRNGVVNQRFSPGVDFQVGGFSSGNTNASTRLNILLSNGGVNEPEANVMTMFSDGRVGIGTANPQRDLHIVGDLGMRVDRVASAGRTAFYLNQLASNGALLGGFGMLADTTTLNIGFSPLSGGLSDNTLNVTRTGNVGIGTTSPSERLSVNGGALISSLAGSGSRMVVANASGVLSTQAIPANQTLSLAGNTLSISGGNSVTLPSSTNLYNADGTVTSARTVNQSTFDLTFSGAGSLIKYSGGASPALFRMGRTSEEMLMGVASAGNDGFTGTAAGDAWLRTNLASGNLWLGTLGTTASLRLVTNGAQRMSISPAGSVTINGLSGTGSRMVVADASGVLGTQALPVNTDSQTLSLAGNTLSISGGNSVTLPASTNIYNTNGTLTGNRTVDLNLNQLRFNMGGTANDITLGAGHAGTNPRVAAADTLEFQTGGNAYQLTLFGNGNVGIGSQGNSAGFRPTSSSRIELNGSVGFPIRRITSASTLGIGDYTVIANAFAAGFAITLPAPNTCEGRVYVIRKVDESSNAITFTFTGITGSNAIRVSDTSATQGEYINSLNFTKTLRIQSNGTDWYLID